MQTICDKDPIMQNNDLMLITFEREMKKHGLRITSTRQAIFDILRRSNTPLSIQQLVKQINQAHFVSVYRSTHAMYMAGVVRQVPIGFKNLFELSDAFQAHHHHATCEKCGNSQQIHNYELENLMTRLSKESGLLPTKHHFELFGVCQHCLVKSGN